MMRKNSNKIANKLHPSKGNLYLKIEAANVNLTNWRTIGKQEPIKTRFNASCSTEPLKHCIAFHSMNT